MPSTFVGSEQAALARATRKQQVIIAKTAKQHQSMAEAAENKQEIIPRFAEPGESVRAAVLPGVAQSCDFGLCLFG